MNISFRPSTNLLKAAQCTFDNMRIYYEQFAPDWNVDKILEVTSPLENIDILCDESVVGVMRLQFDSDGCTIRDLQIDKEIQNKGIGRIALREARRRAINARKTKLFLRVLRVSPAVRLYLRDGFVTFDEDERFYNMSKSLRE